MLNSSFFNVVGYQFPSNNVRMTSRKLGSTTLALPTLMILGVWKGIGWNMVIFLAGLQSIPQELYEAARVDGANRWALFRMITLPLLRPTITFAVVILTMGGFGSFIPMFVLTGRFFNPARRPTSIFS